MARGRIRRYGSRAVKSLALVVAILLVSVVALLAALDTALVRARVRALVRLPIDWQRTRLSLTSGLRLQGFSIANQAPFDRVAPNFLEVDSVDVSWALLRTLGSGPLTERLVISGVRVVVIVDAQGGTSLSALSTPEVAKQGAPIPASTPLSQALEVLGDRLPIEHVVLRDANVRVIRLADGLPARELEAAIEAELTLPKLNDIEAQLSVRLVRQALIEELPPVGELLRLDARASFRPAEHQVLAELRSLQALDHALRGSASLVLPDQGAPLLARAQLLLDTAPVQATLDHQKSPLHLKGTLRVDAAGVRARKLPVVEPGGKVELEAKLGSLDLKVARLHVEGDGLDVRATLLGPPSPPSSSTVAPLGRAEVAVKAGLFALANGGFSIALHRIDMGARIDGLDPYAADPLRAAQALHTVGRTGRMELRPGPLSVIGEGMVIRGDVRLPGDEPGTLELAIPIEAVSVALRDQSLIERQAAQLHVGVQGIRLDLADLLRSQGSEHSELRVGPLAIRSHLDKGASDGVSYDLDVTAATLAALAQLIPLPAGQSVSWPAMSAHVHTTGRIDGLRAVSQIRLRHRTQLEIANAALHGKAEGRVRKLALLFASQGGLVRHTGELELDVTELEVGEYVLGSSRLSAKVSLDRGRPSLGLAAQLQGERVPSLALDAQASYAPGALTWSIETRAQRLGPVERFVPRAFAARHRVAWPVLSFALAGKGVLRRSITGFTGWRPRLVADALEAARGDAQLAVDVVGFDYTDTVLERRAKLGALRVAVTVRAQDGDATDRRPTRQVKASLELDHGKVESDGHWVAVTDWKPTLSIDARGPARTPEASVALDMTLGKVEQDYYPPYPVGQVTLGATVRANTTGLLRVERLELDNRTGGSRMALKGGVDLAAPLRHDAARHDDLIDDDRASAQRLPGRVGLDVELELGQRLGAFPFAPGVILDGDVKLPVRVQSADLKLFLVRGVLGLSGVNATIKHDFAATKVEGQIPIAAELLVERGRKQDGTTETRLRLVPHAEGVSFPRPRFAEHQPFLAERSFFSADKLRYRSTELGPLAGNLSIDHTRVQLSQIEMLAAGGRVRGQLLADLAGADTLIAFRGDVTGVMPPSAKRKDDRLDANLSLVLRPMRLQIDGRAELTHISRPLLLDLLDVWDPYHAELNANRARLALKFGYPERVRLGFEQGFASLRLELGGLTRAVRIDEIKGVPMGPLLEHFLGSALRPLTMAEGTSPPTQTETAP